MGWAYNATWVVWCKGTVGWAECYGDCNHKRAVAVCTTTCFIAAWETVCLYVECWITAIRITALEELATALLALWSLLCYCEHPCWWASCPFVIVLTLLASPLVKQTMEATTNGEANKASTRRLTIPVRQVLSTCGAHSALPQLLSGVNPLCWFGL